MVRVKKDKEWKPRYNLERAVVRASEAKKWEDAKKEWIVWCVEEMPDLGGVCVCGQPGLKYLWTIRNVHNGEELYPIGSVCIDYFREVLMTEHKKQIEKVLRQDNERFEHDKPKTQFTGMTYFDIFTKAEWFLECLIQKWKPSQLEERKNRNNAFLKLIKWYTIRKTMSIKKVIEESES
jgi:hypothetical protein